MLAMKFILTNHRSCKQLFVQPLPRNNKIHFDLAKLSELGSTPNSKLATFYEIREEIEKNDKIKFKIPDPPVKADLLQSTEIVKNEISSMLKGKDHFSKKIKDAFVPMWTIGSGNPG